MSKCGLTLPVSSAYLPFDQFFQSSISEYIFLLKIVLFIRR